MAQYLFTKIVFAFTHMESLDRIFLILIKENNRDIKDFLYQLKKKPVLLEKNIKRFEDAIMPDVVSKDDKQYTIPEKWKVKS